MDRAFLLKRCFSRGGFLVVMTTFVLASYSNLSAQPVIPGTGEWIEEVGDDFEDEKWSYVFNHPKSSHNLDKNIRVPGGFSNNRRWAESAKRGTPDMVKRIPTPPNGIKGSKGALLLATKHTGVPGRPSWEMQQDDFLINAQPILRRSLPVSWTPSLVVRVYMPPFKQWENRTGTTFGIRADCVGNKGSWRSSDSYWPGFFIHFDSESDGHIQKDAARFILRAGPRGYDFNGPKITKLGWWTIGMSFSRDGQVHYYAKPGVEDLTEKDHIGSQFAYSFHCTEVNTFFFNVANMDNGRTWSTPWVTDDPAIYFVRPGSKRQATKSTKKRQ